MKAAALKEPRCFYFNLTLSFVGRFLFFSFFGILSLLLAFLMFFSVFDPAVVKDILDHCLQERKKKEGDKKGANHWLLDTKVDFTTSSIAKRVDSWKQVTSGGPRCRGTEQQMVFIANVLEYMDVLHRGIIGHDGKPKVRTT